MTVAAAANMRRTDAEGGAVATAGASLCVKRSPRIIAAMK